MPSSCVSEHHCFVTPVMGSGYSWNPSMRSHCPDMELAIRRRGVI